MKIHASLIMVPLTIGVLWAGATAHTNRVQQSTGGQTEIYTQDLPDPKMDWTTSPKLVTVKGNTLFQESMTITDKDTWLGSAGDTKIFPNDNTSANITLASGVLYHGTDAHGDPVPNPAIEHLDEGKNQSTFTILARVNDQVGPDGKPMDMIVSDTIQATDDFGNTIPPTVLDAPGSKDVVTVTITPGG